MTLFEADDLHPRVAYDLHQRGLLFVNEYRYGPYRMEDGGSIDFVAIDPKTGQVHIIECKLKIKSLPELEDQLYKYFHAFYVLDARKEVYVFDVSDDQKQWLASRSIDVHVLSMATLQAPLMTSWQTWEDFETIFDYWHIGGMLPRISLDETNPYLFDSKKHHLSSYRGDRARFYKRHLESGDLSPYFAHIPSFSEANYYGDAE